MADSKVWFITGCSKGFGRIWAEAALERGDKVAATARDVSTLAPLAEKYGGGVLALTLDVQDMEADHAAVEQAHERFGRLDVVVNNAGYGLFGTIEEVSAEQARDQIETNVFGALWVTKAALPILRGQGSGHIIQVSSIGGVTAFPGIGLYHASKWALEAFSQSLSLETADLGINVTLIEPQGYSTDWGGPSAVHAEQMPAYDGVRETNARRRGAGKPGDPEASGAAILKLVDAEKPPLRCFFGANAFEMVRPDYERRIANWEEWDWLAKEAHGGE
ncbi:MAG TPA: SDR family oxidoreductase [Solirubrobacterales bacterium]|nr:SDR family oxidoreductase [Solirubrobacterales bacterium]